jgi:hypothetical protein
MGDAATRIQVALCRDLLEASPCLLLQEARSGKIGSLVVNAELCQNMMRFRHAKNLFGARERLTSKLEKPPAPVARKTLSVSVPD